MHLDLLIVLWKIPLSQVMLFRWSSSSSYDWVHRLNARESVRVLVLSKREGQLLKTVSIKETQAILNCLKDLHVYAAAVCVVSLNNYIYVNQLCRYICMSFSFKQMREDTGERD